MQCNVFQRRCCCHCRCRCRFLFIMSILQIHKQRGLWYSFVNQLLAKWQWLRRLRCQHWVWTGEHRPRVAGMRGWWGWLCWNPLSSFRMWWLLSRFLMAWEHQTWQNVTEITPWTPGEVLFYGRGNFSFQFNFLAKLTIFFAAPTDWRKQQERQPWVQCRRQPRWFLPRHTCLQLHQKLQWDQGEGGHKRNFLNWDYIFRFSTAWRLMEGAQWNIQQTPHSLQRNTKLFNLPATGNFDRLHFPYFPPFVPKNRG